MLQAVESYPGFDSITWDNRIRIIGGAGVTQQVESLPSKQVVGGSSPLSRSSRYNLTFKPA